MTSLLENLAEAVLANEALLARELTLELHDRFPQLAAVESPSTSRADVLVVSAALVEMFAQRRNQPAPDWSRAVGGLPQKAYLVKSAYTMRNLRALCDAESPEPLKSRGLLAPPDYLSFA